MRTVVADGGSLTGQKGGRAALKRAAFIGIVPDDVKGYIHRPMHIGLGRMHRVDPGVS